MANQQQRDLLLQGVTAWNAWRQQHPYTPIDLSGADLSRADLSRADLFKANLSGARLSRADLSRANLSYADLFKAYLSGADLSRAHLREAHLREARLSSANLSSANLSSANLSSADLSSADLSGANLREAHLRKADLRKADLREANLREANLREADLSGAPLSGVDLSGIHLSGVDLSGADLSGVDLSGVDLSGVDLREANLREADLSGVDLSGVDLSRADLSYADLSRANLREADLSYARVGRTIFGDIDLHTVKGLETVEHGSPSTIGVDTLLRSEGHIPEAFLRGAGVTDTFISYIRSLTQNPIEYYTCFISYSSHDQPFAERLHADLQSKGVRCWFAPEDLKIGDEFRQRIDETIRLYDKLLIVLSCHSIQSRWVKKEVETAFEKEYQQNKLVLFPIKLDETIMQTNEAWAADIRRMRHIGDFIKWKEHDSYQTAFQRLMRDLQAEHPAIHTP